MLIQQRPRKGPFPFESRIDKSPILPNHAAMKLTFQNAQILGPDGWHGDPIHIDQTQIAADIDARSIDLSGYMILPGMIDLHGDAFEKHVAPRRGAISDIATGFAAIETELASCGITTAYLAQFFSWEGGMRSPRFAHDFLSARTTYNGLGTDLRVQLRFETHMIDDYTRLKMLIEMFDIDYVVLNDHLPHAHLAQGKKPPRLTGQALRAGRNPEAQYDMMQRLHANTPRVPAALSDLLAELPDLRFGSHDDHAAEDRRAWHDMGVRISEFPETIDAAVEARALGDHIVIGAPNAMRGGSHNRNAAAHDLIRAGLVDALASDYHYPAMRLAVLRLVRDGVLAFEDAWHLISTGPAQVMNLSDRGDLSIGKRADLVIMRADDHRIMGTMAGGHMTYLAGPLVERFLSI